MIERPSGKDEWYTPPWVFDLVDVQFGLDPCSPGAAVVPWIPATACMTKVDDGLEVEWPRWASVWLNPPYGRGIGRWLDRFVAHGHGVALVPARTDTVWCHKHERELSALQFLAGRVSFVDKDKREFGSPTFGSVLVSMGREHRDVLEYATVLNPNCGWLVKPMMG